MKRTLRIVICLVSIFLTLLLEGCISLYTSRATIIDTGGAIANIGQQRPRLRTESERKSESSPTLHYRVWKKGEHYIVQLPVSYVPTRYSMVVHFAGKNTWRRTTLNGEFPSPRYSDAELEQYPIEYYSAELTAEQYHELFQKRRQMKEPSRGVFENVRIRPFSEIDLTGAELVRDKSSDHFPFMRLWRGSNELPPPRRTWYNRCLMPLSWTAEVVDIPLSAIATPIGWVVDAIYEPMNN